MLKRLGSFFLDIIQVIIFAVAIFLFVYLLVLQPHKIKGHSMDSNFADGQFLLTEKVTYRFEDPERGDVVVFKAPPDDKDEFIKRIIGLPGEQVSIRGGYFYINGELLEESYINEPTLPGSFLTEGATITVPEGEYFMVGDNRDGSHDSRNFGPIAKKKITGRAWVSYYPLDRAGVVEEVTY